MQDFKDKVAVITGGAGGVGRAIGIALAKEGAKVVISDVNEEKLKETVAELQAIQADAIAIRSDVSKLDSMKALADEVYEKFGQVDLMFANAGIGAGEFGNLWDYDDNDWNFSLNVNVWGVINSIRAFMPRMTDSKNESHFVITGSANGALLKLPYTPIYTMTKAAVQSITENLYQQCNMMGFSVKVSGLFPGPHTVATGIFDSSGVRPDELAADPNKPDFGMKTADDMVKMMAEAGVQMQVTQPEEVAATALQGIRDDKFWILPLTEEIEGMIETRHQSIMQRTNPEIPSL